MANCPSCEHPTAEGGRYCAHCGTSLLEGPDLLGIDDPASSTGEPLQQAGVAVREPQKRWALVALSAVVVAAGFLLLRPGPEADVPGPQTTARPTTRGPTSSDPNDQVNSTTVPPNDSEEGASDDGTAAPLGEAIDDYSLWVGSNDRLTRHDLATGEVTEYEGRGWPIYASAEHLVLLSPFGGRMEAVPIDDPDGEDSVTISPNIDFFGSTVAAAEDPGEIWMLERNDNGYAWIRVRLRDGAALAEIPAGISLFGAAGVGPLVGSAAGTVFEWIDGGYQELTSGDLLAANDTMLLIRRCEQLNRCRLVWVDRADGTELDRPGPEVDAGLVTGGYLPAGGRVLSLWSFEGIQLFDLDDGSPIAESAQVFDPTAISVSPDGRYLAVGENQIRVFDLETDDWFNLGSTGGDGRVLFVADG